ncbi:MAG: hypothetical protein JXR36_10815 [Bacteroidales bacterium]|nr:hypothetical protein [Bacteroidales bacterium]
MRNILIFMCFFLLAVVVFSSCSRDEDYVQNKISGKWNVEQTAVPDSAPVEVASGSYFLFNEDGSGHLALIFYADTTESDLYYNITWFNNTQWFSTDNPAQESNHVFGQTIMLYNVNDYKASTDSYYCVNSDGMMEFRIAYINKKKGKLILFYDTDDNSMSTYINYQRQRTYYYCQLEQ